MFDREILIIVAMITFELGDRKAWQKVDEWLCALVGRFPGMCSSASYVDTFVLEIFSSV
jgi:hypothetical protein